MAIPDYQTLMLPVLKILGDGKEHSLRELVDRLAAEFGLTEDELEELTPRGGQGVFLGRVGWAKTYMSQAGLLSTVKRGVYRISQRGAEVLGQNPDRIDNKYLQQFPEFRDFQLRSRQSRKQEDQVSTGPTRVDTPEELIEASYTQLRAQLASDLLEHVKSLSPSAFERLVVELLVRMGYGGSREDAGRAVGRSGDGGIDGVINEDRLGLDVVYIQAKRWENSVGRPDVQAFAGALAGQKARKGVMITTSSFSRHACDFVTQVQSKIVLIDGEELAELMIDFGLGVAPVALYEIKKVDTDFFE